MSEPERIDVQVEAQQLLDEEAQRYRNELYVISKRNAERDLNRSIITTADVERAKQLLWKKVPRIHYYDGLLSGGSLLLGLSVPHILALLKEQNNLSLTNLVILFLGFAGALILGAGIIGKAKQ